MEIEDLPEKEQWLDCLNAEIEGIQAHGWELENLTEKPKNILKNHTKLIKECADLKAAVDRLENQIAKYCSL